MTKKIPSQKELAAAFLIEMRKALPKKTLKEIDKRNKGEQNQLLCHSHDFCDPNQVMIDAWESLSSTAFSLRNTKHLVVVNRAWDLTKSEGFSK